MATLVQNSQVSINARDMESYRDEMANLPSSSSPSLILAHSSQSEIYKTHELSSTEWAGALTKEQYIENEHQLASHLGITHWILTQTHLPPDKRPIFASCETIRKRCFVRDGDMGVREALVDAIAAVFCEPKMRGRGYAGRMMKDLGALLRDRAVDDEGVESVGSVLWSDIGPKFYAGLGWAPFPSTHVELPASPRFSTVIARAIPPEDIGEFCAKDQALLLESMRISASSKTLLAIVPDQPTMLWHHMKEDYICQKEFRKQPRVKGAVVGEPGNRVWAIWTRGIYGPLDDPYAGSKLYILRLVIENTDPEDREKQTEQLKAVLQAAQHEAEEWKLGHVELWNPDERTMGLIEETRLEYQLVKRKTEGIPSLMWFGGKGGGEVEWIVSEKYTWC
jgi:hypothetical protein